jgi:hypothetical protein
MPEPHPGADLQQAGLDRRGRRLGADAKPLGCPPHQHRVADRIGRRDQQQRTSLLRKGLQPPPEALLDPT